MYLHLGSNPRVLYLVTSSHDDKLGRPSRVLVFRAGESSSSQAVVEFLPKNQVNLSNTIRLTNRVVKGCLGLISIENGASICLCLRVSMTISRQLDIFLAVVTSATEVGNTRPSGSTPESVARIHEVCFYSLSSATWDDASGTTDAAPSPDNIDASMARDNYAQSTAAAPGLEHPCMPLTKILSSGSFYYALESHWDLSSRLTVGLAHERSKSKDAGSFDERFVWNEYIVRSLLDFRDRLDVQEREDLDRCQFIVIYLRAA